MVVFGSKPYELNVGYEVMELPTYYTHYLSLLNKAKGLHKEDLALYLMDHFDNNEYDK